jgi:3-isopropylmalate/(R)-2-methylmalate dehydratase large subunit
LTFATPDRAISTAHDRAGTIKIGQELLAALRVETTVSAIQLFDIDEPCPSSSMSSDLNSAFRFRVA